MKRLIILIIAMFLGFSNIQAKDNITIYIFHGEGCYFCSNALSFLKSYEEENDNVKLIEYEVWNNTDNKKLMNDIASILDTNITGVPFIVIGDTYFKGFGSGDDEKINESVRSYREEGYRDVVQMYLNGEISLEDNTIGTNDENIDKSNEYLDRETKVSSTTFDLKKGGIAFLISALIIILIILKQFQNNSTYGE